MPELPEVEITARLIGRAVAGRRVERVKVPGLNALKTFKPPIEDLEGHELTGVRRRGKLLIVDSASGLSVLIHLMSAGRLQLFGKPATIKDRTARVLLGLGGGVEGEELRLREFGTRQRAWAKVMPTADVEGDEVISGLGPDAWPEPPDLRGLLTGSRPLYSELRDQRVIAGIGRSWVDEILWQARLSPFKRGGELTGDEAERLRSAVAAKLGGAIERYEADLSLPLPDKLPLPLEVHRHAGEPCPRCGATIASISFSEYELCYCPEEQTGGKVLKDRRLSRLLK